MYLYTLALLLQCTFQCIKAMVPYFRITGWVYIALIVLFQTFYLGLVGLYEVVIVSMVAITFAALLWKGTNDFLLLVKQVEKHTIARLQHIQPVGEPIRLSSYFEHFLSEEAIGDLQEEREELIQSIGVQAADRWYTRQVLASIWPMLFQTVARMVSKIAK